LTAGYLAGFPHRVESAVFIAPVGLMEVSKLDEASQAVMRGKESEDGEEVRDWVFNFLEDGELVVPIDWEERVGRGEVVPEAIRQWECDNHEGYQASVIGIVRDGKVFDNHEAFEKAPKTGKRCLVILGEEDDVATREDCEGVGMGDVKVVKGVGHGLVRQRVEEVGDHIEDFWKTLGLL
jgi:pimeloyl-ACP methyl ester carboxylesterase